MSNLLIPRESDFKGIALAVIKYLEEHKEVNLRVYIIREWGSNSLPPLIMDEVTNELRKQGMFEIEEQGIGDTQTFIISKKTWRERNPLLAEVRVGLITAAFALLVGWLLTLPKSQEQAQTNTQQAEQLVRLSDSLKNIESRIKDSLSVLRKLNRPVVVRTIPLNP